MKYFVIAFFGLALMATSCKKEGCTDLDATNFDGKAKKDDGSCVYNTPPVVIDTICDGLQVDNTNWPLYSGIYRKYKHKIYGINPTIYNVTEQVLGQETISSVLWYKVRVISYMIPLSPTETFEYYRKDNLTGNVYKQDGAGEVLMMTGFAELGQELDGEFFISNLNGSKTTAECSYSNCIVATNTTDPEAIETFWFKKGVGLVAFKNDIGEFEIIELHD